MSFARAPAIRIVPVVLAALLALPALAPAGSADAPGVAWSNAASPGGGPVWGMGGSAAVLVASTVDNGAYRSFDGGFHWEPIPDFPPVSEARSIVFDPTDPLVGYVAGFGGVARTLDGGESWTLVLPSYVSYRLTVSPSGAVLASLRDDDQYQRIHLSTDRGDTWTDLGMPEARWTSLYGLAFGRTDDEIVAKSISVLWATQDGGATWTESRMDGLALVRDEADGAIWMSGMGLRRSHDGGATWQDVSAPADGWPLAARPGGGVTLATHEGILHTDDGGATWTNMGAAEERFGATSILHDPADPDAVLFSDEFLGVMRVAPDGRIESRTTGLQPIPILGLAASRDGSVLLAGSTLGLYASRDGGDSWSHTGAGAGLMGIRAAAASDDGTTLFGGGQNRVFQPFLVMSRDGGATWHWKYLDIGGDGFVAGLVFEPGSTTHAYAAVTMDLAASHLLETKDGGRNWASVFSMPGKIRDVAWDRENDRLVVATEMGVLTFPKTTTLSGAVNVAVPLAQGATMNTWTVAAEAGHVWSNGFGANIWRDNGLVQAPWADPGEYVVDLAPESGGAAVWAADKSGLVFRCVGGEPLGTCEDRSAPGLATSVLVANGRVFAGTLDGGIYVADP